MMKILWITNIIFPEAAESLTGKGEIRSTGGWLVSMLDSLRSIPGIELFTATVSSQVSELVEVKGGGVVHYIFPAARRNYTYEKKYEPFWKKIIESVNPDIIHIHGTECPHGLPCLRLFPDRRYVVNIQGLVSEIANHYYDGLSWMTILKNITLRDLYKGSLFRDKAKFTLRGKCEKIVLLSVSHIIGRTTWDHAVVKAINPNLKYHLGNESLRNVFYTGNWSYHNCIPHTIFLSQVGWSFKGFHILLKAMPLIQYYYPDVKIRIAGENVTRDKENWQSRIKLSNYGKILKSIIRKYNLEQKITFLGRINAEEMKKELLSANVFVSCSSIENSSNSLGEAQLLGVPCVASYVGGIPDMIPNENCGYMYRYEDYQELAFLIEKVFNQSSSFDNTEMRQLASERHNIEKNVKSLIDVYKEMMANNE